MEDFSGRRIIPRDGITGVMQRPRAEDPARRCHHTIELDGTVYRCGRETRLHDRQHDGIHDAFVVHHDGGTVRW